MAFSCPIDGCDGKFTEKRNLTRHIKNQHGNLWSCQRCNQTFNRCDNYEYHQRTCLFKTTGKRSGEDIETVNKKRKDNVNHTGGALQDTLADYRLSLEDEEQDAGNIMKILKDSVLQLENRVKEELKRKNAIKFYISLHANFHLSSDPSFTTDPPVVLNTEVEEIYESSEVDEILDKTFENLLSNIENFELRGSGWVLDRLMHLDLHVFEFSPLRATSYIPLPKELQNKKGVVNIKNTDEKCFLWSVIAGLYGDRDNNRNANRVSHYKEYENQFNLKGISFPMPLSDIPKFERRNDVSISVYGYQNGKDGQEGFVYPLKVSKEVNERHVDLLLIASDDTNHYCYIKDFGKLVGSQYSSTNAKTYFCRFCLHGFSRHSATGQDQHRRNDEEMKQKLKDHEQNCFAFAAQRIEFPEDPVVKFKNVHKQVHAPFVVYADFESILKSLSQGNKSQEHLACSYAYQIVSNVPGIEFDLRRPYVGLDAVDKFLDSLQDDLNKYIMPLIEKDVEMIWDDEAKRKFQAATRCHVCKKELCRTTDTVARDHCHFTCRFRGAAHQQCNLDYKIEKSTYKMPIVFHNLRGYDAHLIFQKVKRRHGKIDVIPNNSERYISFTVGRMKFLDSMQFLSCSLEKLAAQLEDEQFVHLKNVYTNPTQRSLLTKKGVYCYDYMNSIDKFDETCLPYQRHFFNSLTGEHISDKQYQHADNVWKTLNCTTMRDYHNHYLISDVLLLADVFENFRNMSLTTFDLDPLHYYSLPGLSWDAMLKYTDVELELITDTDMYQMVEKGMRGGISNISHRYATSNHHNMTTYNAEEKTRTLTYQDANALYSWAMSELLPIKNFKWVSPNEIDILNVPRDNRIGYILEVDLEYPEELHDEHNLYPLTPAN